MTFENFGLSSWMDQCRKRLDDTPSILTTDPAPDGAPDRPEYREYFDVRAKLNGRRKTHVNATDWCKCQYHKNTQDH